MVCGSCAQRAKEAASKKKTTNKSEPQFVPSTEKSLKNTVALPMAEKSASSKKVKLRYLGGGYSTKGQGCRSCGGTGTKYKFVSSERIQFVSEDSPDNWFNMLFTVGHDYYVTEKQAEYLLTLTYTSKVGKVANKFEKIA
jgi:hypothetical protein